MLIYPLAFVGGVLRILSPCILPVLPFVFSPADRPFRRSGLPLLVGMALTFAMVATVAAFGGHWVVQLNQGGRYLAMSIFLILGISLLFPSVAEQLARPLVRAGSRLGNSSVDGSVGRSLDFWGFDRPALDPMCRPDPWADFDRGGNSGTGRALLIFILLSFALGAATSLGIALFAGTEVFSAMKRSLSLEAWTRRGLGIAVILGVVAIALGWETNMLTRFSFVNTAAAEEHLIGRLHQERPAVLAASATLRSTARVLSLT